MCMSHFFLYLARIDPCEDLHCTEDEWCGEKDGKYGCFCNENYPRQNPDSYGTIYFTIIFIWKQMP